MCVTQLKDNVTFTLSSGEFKGGKVVGAASPAPNWLRIFSFQKAVFSRVKVILFVVCICDKYRLGWYIVFRPPHFLKFCWLATDNERAKLIVKEQREYVTPCTAVIEAIRSKNCAIARSLIIWFICILGCLFLDDWRRKDPVLKYSPFEYNGYFLLRTFIFRYPDVRPTYSCELITYFSRLRCFSIAWVLTWTSIIFKQKKSLSGASKFISWYCFCAF